MKGFIKYIKLFVLLMVIWMIGGCATSSDENISERPWNVPQKWERGLPYMMDER